MSWFRENVVNRDWVPGINVGNAFRQIINPTHNYDVLDNVTTSGRPGQVRIPDIDPTSRYHRPSGGGTVTSGGSSGSGNTGNQTTTAAATGGGYAVSSYDAQAAQDARERAFTIGQLEQEIAQINNAIRNLQNYERTGINRIDDAYNKNLSRLNQQRSNALTRYNTQRGDTRGDFDDASGDVDSMARNNYQAMMNLLGRAGAGSSSAAEVLTPYAVSEDASKTRGEIANVYGRNLRDLDMAEEEAEQSYNNSRADLGDQRKSSKGELKQRLGEQRSSLLSSRAQAMGNKTLAEGGDWQTAKSRIGDTVRQLTANERALSNLLDQYRNPYKVQDVKARNVKTKNYAFDSDGVRVEDSPTGHDTDTAVNWRRHLEDEDEERGL